MGKPCGLRAELIALLTAAGERGLTKPEVERALGIESVRAQTLADKLIASGRVYRLHDFGETPRWGIGAPPKPPKLRSGPKQASRDFKIAIGVKGRPTMAPVKQYTRNGIRYTVSQAPAYDIRFCVDPRERIVGGFRSAGVGIDATTGRAWA